MNQLNFSAGTIRAGSGGIAVLQVAARGRRFVHFGASASLRLFVVLAAIRRPVAVAVLAASGILLALLLDAMVRRQAPAALPGTLDPVAGRRSETVRIALAELICRSKDRQLMRNGKLSAAESGKFRQIHFNDSTPFIGRRQKTSKLST